MLRSLQRFSLLTNNVPMMNQMRWSSLVLYDGTVKRSKFVKLSDSTEMNSIRYILENSETPMTKPDILEALHKMDETQPDLLMKQRIPTLSALSNLLIRLVKRKIIHCKPSEQLLPNSSIPRFAYHFGRHPRDQRRLRQNVETNRLRSLLNTSSLNKS